MEPAGTQFTDRKMAGSAYPDFPRRVGYKEPLSSFATHNCVHPVVIRKDIWKHLEIFIAILRKHSLPASMENSLHRKVWIFLVWMTASGNGIY